MAIINKAKRRCYCGNCKRIIVKGRKRISVDNGHGRDTHYHLDCYLNLNYVKEGKVIDIDDLINNKDNETLILGERKEFKIVKKVIKLITPEYLEQKQKDLFIDEL